MILPFDNDHVRFHGQAVKDIGQGDGFGQSVQCSVKAAHDLSPIQMPEDVEAVLGLGVRIIDTLGGRLKVETLVGR